ncbi:MAG: hypothetical protein OEW12_08440 [Deltaproteobacteria bacterium]|nr:hypothetical protein [Deltaproteobacteria bacterium]
MMGILFPGVAVVSLLAPLLGSAPNALAQEAPVWEKGDTQVPAPPPEQLVDESFSFRMDEDVYQFEEAVTLISTAMGKVADKVSVIAINSVYFGGEYQGDFRHKAKVIFLEKLLAANPSIKLLRCQECEKLETKLVRGVLRIRKGLPDAEARIALGKKLGADGFIDIGVFKESGQITVYLQVTEASTGAILLVEELGGRKAFRRHSMTLSLGDMKFPINISGSTTVHNALAVTFRETVQLSNRFSFGVDLSAYMDNNKTNPDPHITLSAGGVLLPFLGYDVLQFPESTTRLTAYIAVGKMLAPQFNYPTITGGGVIFIVGDRLEMTIGSNSYPDTYLTNGEILSGSGLMVLFGYRW